MHPLSVAIGFVLGGMAMFVAFAIWLFHQIDTRRLRRRA